MFKRQITLDDLERLHDKREQADRRYNDALTALDDAVRQLRDMPHPPPPFDEHQITPINERWDLLAVKAPEGTGWRRRMRSFIWAMVGPLFERQHAFNAALVDHINRNIAMHREVREAVASSLVLLRDELEGLVNFQHKVVQYAQEITLYVDTKDREINGAMRRIHEDVAVGASGGLSGLSDELQKCRESMVAHERRYQSQVEDLRASFAVTTQVTQTLKRALERLQAPTTTSPPQPPAPTSAYSALDSYKYVAFEDLFRGSTDEIRERVAAYVPYFAGAADVLDVGCGRGEFLDLLREHGISARGVDINHEMVELCRDRGLTANEGDVLSYLHTLPDASLGGLFAAQVVEHLEPAYLLQFLDAAYLKLRPGARLVLETINVASWSAFFHSYLRDITHVRPLHPDTLSYLVTASAFLKVEVVYRSPCADSFKLEPLPELSRAHAPTAADMDLSTLIGVFNVNVEKLNRQLFANQDYAVIGERR